MKWAKRIGKALAATIVLAAALQLAAPRAVHSAVAALVSVVGNVAVTNPLNSSGGPQPLVVQDVASGAGAPVGFELSCEFDGGICSSFLPEHAWPDQNVVVITDISGTCTTNSGLVGTQADYRVASSATRLVVTPNLIANAGGNYYYTFGRQTNLLLNFTDGNAGLGFVADTLGNTTGGCIVSFAGYMPSK